MPTCPCLEIKKPRLCTAGLLWALLIVMIWAGVAAGAVIRDLDELSQDPVSYIDPKTADTPFLPTPEQARLNAESDLNYFAPWHRTIPYHTRELASWGFQKYTGKTGYGKGGRPYPVGWISKLAANAPLEDYPKDVFPAITVNRADFRHLPTREPLSDYSNATYNGDTFDNLQVSSVPAGTPVLVTLVSRDRKWFLAETNHLVGWVPATDIAAVDQQFVKTWENGSYVTIIRDKAPVICDAKTAPYRAPLGAVFSKTGEDGERISTWMAERDAQGKAILRKAWVSKETAVEKPLPFTPRNIARLSSEMVGDPYGWGGLKGKRDCSLLIRDLFAPFGLSLPRNSSEQALAGKVTSLSGLSPQEKETLIVREGVPWRTLLWTPGHIMLYIGTYQGKPLIFHNFWSIRTRDPDGKRGKVIVGHAAITTLHPGSELPNLDLPHADRLYGLEAMVVLGEPVTAPEKKP
jgi:cell wall-associated NlpC family hydrolase